MPTSILLTFLILIFPFQFSPAKTNINKNDQNNHQDAHRAFVSQNYPLAVQLFLQILQNNPNQPKTWYFLGLSYLRQNQYSKAKSSLLKAKSLDPSLSFLKSQKNYYRYLSDIRDAINAHQFIQQQQQLNPPQNQNLPFLNPILWFSSISFILISISGFAFYIHRYRQSFPSLKSESKYQEKLPRLEKLINHLNSEFSQTKQLHLSQTDENLKHHLLEIERISIALNERFHGMKLGFVNLNEQSISEQFTMTQDLLNQIFSIKKFTPPKKSLPLKPPQ